MRVSREAAAWMNLRRLSNNSLIKLGRELGRGGEGAGSATRTAETTRGAPEISGSTRPRSCSANDLDAIRLDKAGLLSQGLSTLLGSPAVRARTDDDASLVIATRRARG